MGPKVTLPQTHPKTTSIVHRPELVCDFGDWGFGSSAMPWPRDCGSHFSTLCERPLCDCTSTCHFFFPFFFTIQSLWCFKRINYALLFTRRADLVLNFGDGNVHFANHFFSTNNTAWSERKLGHQVPLFYDKLTFYQKKHGSFIPPLLVKTDLRSFFTSPKYLLGLFSPKREGGFLCAPHQKGSRNRMAVKILFFLKLAAVKIENVPNLIYEILKYPKLHSRERSFLASSPPKCWFCTTPPRPQKPETPRTLPP